MPSPILAEIMSYLNLFELLNISQVSRKFYVLANSQPLYKREFLQLWINCPSSNERIKSDWKSLCLAGIKVKAGWQNIPDSIFSKTELVLLYDELINTLRSPPFVLPQMRRTIFSMPTLSQDFLANPEDQYVQDEDLEYFSDGIRIYLQENSSDLYFTTSNSDLIQIRWNIKKDKERLSIGSQQTDSSESSSNSLILIYKQIKKVIKTHCKGLRLLILESETPLETYSNNWENFSNSARKINSLFLPITDLLNDFYEANYHPESCPRTNFFKIMNSIWRENVFEPCKDLICQEVLNELQSLYKGEDPFFSQSRRIVEALNDLSLTELNVFFKNHSMLKLEGPYSYFHQKLVESVAANANTGFHQDILQEVVLPVTVREAKQAYLVSQNLEIPQDLLQKTDEDEFIEISAQNHGINMNYNTTEIALFSQNKEQRLVEIINFLELYRNVYIF